MQLYTVVLDGTTYFVLLLQSMMNLCLCYTLSQSYGQSVGVLRRGISKAAIYTDNTNTE
jgi:hypothetical protein